LAPHGKAQAVLSAQQSELGVERQESKVLGIEGACEPLARKQRARRGSSHLFVAGEEVDRDCDAYDEAVPETEVEVAGPLERVADKPRALLAKVVDPQKRIGVVGDQSEAHVEVAEDLRAVDGEEPFGVHGRAKQMGIEAIAGEHRVFRVGEARGKGEGGEKRDCRASHGGGDAKPNPF
jgi:hypothetical protein